MPPMQCARLTLFAPQVVVNNAVQVAATGQLQTGVQFKIDDPTDIEPSVRL